MNEQQIQKKIQDYLKKQGCYVVKVISANRAGVPDILACCNGKFYGIEVKTPKGKPSELQLKHLEMINEAGGVGIIARSVEDIKGFIPIHQRIEP